MDETVERACRLDSTLEIAFLRDAAVDRLGAGFARYSLERIAAKTEGDNRRPLLREQPRHRRADTGRGTRHEEGLVLEKRAHDTLSAGEVLADIRGRMQIFF